ncbi:MAG: TlpA family protein disulfide reductase [Gammaproteobacteria bacterium]|nr:TlpA family protein disulfide reductase [Gammaproteobacteria bacterium]MDH5650967.1 TlpA family protein disulfide reductase [Gammaproteobacteria bacterium]
MSAKLKHIILSLLLLTACSLQATPIEFSAYDLNGKLHKLSDYRGKWVVVNYWATWCPPCLDEIPELVEFHEKHRDKDAVVLGINHEDVSKEELKSFVEQYFISYPVLKAKPGVSSPFGMIHGLPTTFLIDPNGEMVAGKTGGVTQQDLEEAINEFKKSVAKQKI